MGKEFIEYYSENGRIPYSASTVCHCITKYAKEYINSERKLTSNIDKKVRDAVLVDFVNYLGRICGLDFALYTIDLHEEINEDEYVEPRCILTAIPNHCAYYIFNEDIVESVLRNKHMNECTKEFDANDGVVVLLDFINYIAERNEYDRRFTVREFYEKVQKQNYNRNLKELKAFLTLTSTYGTRLNNGEDIDTIFNEIAEKYGLKYISRRGIYYYTDEFKKMFGQAKMLPGHVNNIEKNIYAMAYAYDKSNLNNKPKTEIIRKKVKEMKTRYK